MKKEVKTAVDGLQVGMFVSRLDRPWIKTPFILEGVKIKTPEDIANIRKYCNYVYVDIDQGLSPNPRHWILTDSSRVQTTFKAKSAPPKIDREKEKAQYTSLRKATYPIATKLHDEAITAKEVATRITNDYKTLLQDLERGRDLDIRVVGAGVSDMVESVIRNPSAMMWVIHLKKMDEYIYSRALGTSVWCATFGRQLGLKKSAIKTLATGGLFLDVGKSRLPLEFLKKEGELSDEDMSRMHSHVDLSIKLLVNSSASSNLDIETMQMIASHHERADGSGYPQGIFDTDIPLYGKIAGIVDSYDAMTNERLYPAGRPKSPHEAIAELYELRGTRFQAELVEQFIQSVGLYPTGSLVELNTGEVATIIAVNGLRRLRPTIMILLNEKKEFYPEFKQLDLSLADEEIRISHGLPPGSYGIDMAELFL